MPFASAAVGGRVTADQPPQRMAKRRPRASLEVPVSESRSARETPPCAAVALRKPMSTLFPALSKLMTSWPISSQVSASPVSEVLTDR